MLSYRSLMKRLLNKSGLTKFQVRVLLSTLSIEPGTTITYAQMARRIGSPGASRAVGNALNRNPLPLLIPCHRVVAGNGLGGYRYGRTAKSLLLEIEYITSRSSNAARPSLRRSTRYTKASSAAF